ncbi:MAG TPA: DUF924 family protein [Stellaceae bacterium]|nr:DUF924 family protein [Stellaceae bacterium]
MTDAAPAGPARAQLLLDFWFGAPGSPEHDRPRDIWFRADHAFDAELRHRFLADHEAAAAGALSPWLAAPDSALALVLLLDQLPRNLFRGSPRAYSCDPAARRAAGHAVDRGVDRAVAPVRRWFFYLPFEHSENLADQRRSLELYGSLPADQDRELCLRAAQQHHDIIARFGRFPHRNEVLGRSSTTEEEAFLREPGSRF